MKRLVAVLTSVLFLAAPLLAAKDNQKEQDRVKDAGEVLKEIINIPDDIPKDLFDRAECIIVLPSVKKFAIGVGGSYGRGVMSCRTGQHYTGPWSAPAMYALAGGDVALFALPRFVCRHLPGGLYPAPGQRRK